MKSLQIMRGEIIIDTRAIITVTYKFCRPVKNCVIPSVVARSNSNVRAYDNSNVTAYDNSNVRALGNETSAEKALRKSLDLNCLLIQYLERLKKENTRLKEMLTSEGKEC